MMIFPVFKLSFLILLLSVVSPLMAQDDSQYLLTEKTYKALSAAQDLLAADQYTAAEKQLKSLLSQTDDKSYERAVVQQTLGYLYSAQTQYKQAANFFQLALDSNALPDKISHDLRYNLAQILLADEQYQKGITLLETWLKKESSPPNSAYVLLASAHYRVQNYKKVIENINTAIKRDKSPKEAWYQILLSAHLELKQYKFAIKVLETLITKYPYQENYWKQLAALYLQQDKEFSAVAVRMLAQRLELGDAKTLISLADMYRYLHIPYKSAQLLADAIHKGVIDANFENLERLADSWIAAKDAEKAAETLQQMAQIDNSGESDLKLGRVLTGQEHWQRAVEPLSRSLQKLKGEKVGAASLLLGMVHFHLGDLIQAKTMFSNAVAFENERNQAGQWLRHVENQLAEREDAT